MGFDRASLGAAAFLGVGAAGRDILVTFRDFTATLTARFFALAAAGFALALTGLALVALRARALPAGERLVAGFKRVDLPATTRLRDDPVTVELRDVDREDSFFTPLAIGLLMRKALISKTSER